MINQVFSGIVNKAVVESIGRTNNCGIKTERKFCPRSF